MIISSFFYFITIAIVFHFSQIKHKYFCSFPVLKLNKNGIVFYSKLRHKLKIGKAKFMQVNNCVFINFNKKIVTLKNVDNVVKSGDYLYFYGLGKVEILFDCVNYYKYFCVAVNSTKFNLSNIKQLAMLDLINNKFDLSRSKITKKYIEYLIDILKIKIDEKGVRIGKNQFSIPFSFAYKINNKIKIVHVV